MLSEKDIYAFDSFQGFPDAGEKDKQAGSIKPRYKQYTVGYVKNYLENYGLCSLEIEQKVEFIEGWFPESFSLYNGDPISFLHLDVDLYQSYIDSLNYFYDLVLPGGVIAFDEYKDSDDLRK
ncbi:MAG: hypothetical protein GXP09_03585 [Gammaproteobacteria bacterium]|nr:hypothetical protein [Gammaproteobacteria bacterium]